MLLSDSLHDLVSSSIRETERDSNKLCTESVSDHSLAIERKDHVRSQTEEVTSEN